jgi:phosphatidylserine/phosphatidylglycerophosphate/cardiolipin synthase-like enzyme
MPRPTPFIDDGKKSVPLTNIKSSQDIYLRSVLSRWRKEITEADTPVLIFSPYITSNAAESVLLLAEDKSMCEVYTLFNPEVFVTGGSSISTLRRLRLAGIELFDLPSIHAKMVIIKGKFASIGSQNLTTGGRRRREATITTTDEEQVQSIWEKALVWSVESRSDAVV